MFATSELLVPLSTQRAGDPLYCVHPISGTPYVYSGLARALGAHRPILGLEAPGIGPDGAPVGSIPELSAVYAAALCPADSYTILGWSMGGVIAFDMALRLTAAGKSVATVILIDTPVPSPSSPPSEKAILDRFVRDITGVTTGVDTAIDELFSGLPDTVDPSKVFSAERAADVLPSDIEIEWLERRYLVFRTHVTAMTEYLAPGRFEGNAVHIRASATDAASTDWTTLMPAVQDHVVTGTHHTLWVDSLGEIAEIVSKSIGDIRDK
jgi:thioesterase domain-containing protein